MAYWDQTARTKRVLRFLPAYIITEQHVDEGIAILERVFETQNLGGSKPFCGPSRAFSPRL